MFEGFSWRTSYALLFLLVESNTTIFLCLRHSKTNLFSQVGPSHYDFWPWLKPYKYEAWLAPGRFFFSGAHLFNTFKRILLKVLQESIIVIWGSKFQFIMKILWELEHFVISVHYSFNLLLENIVFNNVKTNLWQAKRYC